MLREHLDAIQSSLADFGLELPETLTFSLMILKV